MNVHIHSLARADAILEALLELGTASLADLCQKTRLKKTTAYYLVETLVGLGFATRCQDAKRYRLGARNIELGQAAKGRLDIATASRGSLVSLCARTKETVNLAVPYLLDAMIVESMEGEYGVRVTSYAGTRSPYHSSACGKAILANLQLQVRQAIYEARPLEARTLHTITEVAELEEQLAEIRKRGYALDIQENEIGAQCVAAPVFDGAAQVVGAISVAGPSPRFTPEIMHDFAQQIMVETRHIGAMLQPERFRDSEMNMTRDSDRSRRKADV